LFVLFNNYIVFDLGITVFMFVAAHNKAIRTNVRNLHIQRHWPQITAVVTITACTMVIVTVLYYGSISYSQHNF